MSPSDRWGRQGKWPPKGTEFKRKGFNLRVRLESMSMKSLRDFCKKNNLEAKDTDKGDLVNEIVKEMEGKNGNSVNL